MQHQYSKLIEGLEHGDLERLISPKLTIDEYKSKMGSDEEIVVISFQVKSKEPALDLVNFLEKSYEWVADADLSSGELFDGSYVVFVELERDDQVPAHIIEMLTDLENLSEHKVLDWKIYYAKPKQLLEPTEDSLSAGIPLTPGDYKKKQSREKQDLDQLKTAAGVKVTTQAPKNDFTESLRSLAGII